MQLLNKKGMFLDLLVKAGLDQLDAELVCMELNAECSQMYDGGPVWCSITYCITILHLVQHSIV